MKNDFRIAVLFVILYSHAIVMHGQPFLASKGSEKANTFLDMQRSFEQWAKEKDLKNEKGWKYYKRWEYENVVRANGDGSIADPGIFYKEAQKISQLKSTVVNNKTESSTWSPVGPMTLEPTDFGIGRINCIAFHPTDSNTFFVGVAQGGVWKTTNGGTSWMPLTDDLPILRISDIAIDPLHPDTMYIAVGDYAYIGIGLVQDDRKRNTHYGMGVYKTTDGGTTWAPTGLAFDQTSFDSSLTCNILVNPANTAEILAAGSRGIWKSLNGGQNWTHILDTLMWDVEKNPLNSNTLYASTGFVKNLNQGYASIIKSTDFGSTWSMLSTGIPPKNAAQRIEIAISPTDTNYIYAVACDLLGGAYGFYRSTDGGATWSLRTTKNVLNEDLTAIGGQGTYDIGLIVDRLDKDKVYVGGLNIWGSKDGGVKWNAVSPYFGTIHPDQHFFAYNNINSKYYVCNDGGVYTTNQLKVDTIVGSYSTNWTNISSGLMITSFYRLGLSKGNANNVIAGAQDNNTFYKLNGNWYNNIIGGDGMECILDPYDTNIFYGSWQYGEIVKYDGYEQSYIFVSEGIGDKGEWTTPYVMHPSNSEILYLGYGNLWKTEDGGLSSNKISDFDIIPSFGYPNLISALAVNPGNPDYIYLAKRVYHLYNQPGELWRTSNGGASWQNITAGLPDSLYFTYIAVDYNDTNTAWVTCAGFYDGVKVFKTTNGGASWTNISYNLPNIPVNCIVNHAGTPNNTVYIATDLGVYYLQDNSNTWQFYSTGLPNVIVSELEIHYDSNKLYAATFGRGIWQVDPFEVSTLSVAQNNFTAEIELFPNPNKGSFNLITRAESDTKAMIEIVDITGRKVYAEYVNLSPYKAVRNYDLKLGAGFYYLKISAGKNTKTLRFVVN